MPWGSSIWPSSIWPSDVVLAASITYSVPGGLALPADVDQDQRVVASHHLVRQVEAARSEVHHLDAVGKVPPGEHPRHLAPEPVIPKPGVADPGDEDLLGPLCSHSWRLHLVGEEEQVAPGLAHQVLAGVVVDRHGQVHAVVEVDVDPLERRPSAVEQPVVTVRSVPGLSGSFVPAPKVRRRPSTRSSPGLSSAPPPP